MDKINLSIKGELQKTFRKLATDKFGLRKECLKKVIEEAIYDWIEKTEGDYQDG